MTILQNINNDNLSKTAASMTGPVSGPVSGPLSGPVSSRVPAYVSQDAHKICAQPRVGGGE